MRIILNDFEKTIDKEVGAVLFRKKGFQGIPDKILDFDGYTVEFKNDEIVFVDIYDAEEALLHFSEIQTEQEELVR